MSSLSIQFNFQGIGNLCRFLHYAKRDNGLATTFKGVFRNLSSAEFESDKSKKLQFLAAAMKDVNTMAKELQRYNQEDFAFKGIDRDVTLWHTEGMDVFQQLRGVNSANLSGIIKKIQAVVRTHFKAPEEVDAVIAAEAARQEARVFNMKVCTGLVGFYEMIMNRPHLQYEVGNQGRDYKFLSVFPRKLITLIHSFSQTGSNVKKEEGLAALDFLMNQADLHTDRLKELYPTGSETEIFMAKLIDLKGNKESQNRLYEDLKRATLSQCALSSSSSSTVDQITREDLNTFFNEKAQEIAASLPPEFQVNREDVVKRIAGGFQQQTAHGNGMLVSGIEGLGGSDLLGQGIYDERTFNTPINPYENWSLDSLKNDRIKQRIKEIGISIAKDFYDRGLLVSTQYTAMGSVIAEEPVYDPIQQALMTVNSLIRYELAEYGRTRGYLFGLDEAQKQRLVPELTKKVILSGIKRDVFNTHQTVALLVNHHLMQDADIQTAVNQAAVRRQGPALFRQNERSSESSADDSKGQ